ncbi:MAG: hypothetical protein ACK5RX_09685 [bacterium]
MRIITRKLHKAFRELDRFEEPRARAFVRVASSGWRARGFRYGVMAVVAMPMLFGLVILVGWVASLGSRTTLAQDIVHTGIALTLGLALTFLAVMLTRDQMLRWRIRRLIRRRGTCQMCNYSLLGMTVGPDLVVTCPECGDKLKADPAMNELATTADGRRTYTPSGQVDSPAYIAARERRRKLAVRWLVGTPLCLLVLVGISFGIWRYWLASMARQARADRNFDVLATALVESAHPAGALELPNQWEDLVLLLQSIQTTSNQIVIAEAASSTEPYNDPAYLRPDFEQFYRSPAQVSDAQGGPEASYAGWDRKRRAIAERVIKELAEDGTLDRMKSIQSIQHATRPLAPGSEAFPLQSLYSSEINTLYPLVSMNAARMEMALSKANMPEYLAALDQTLATARIMDRQATIRDRVYADYAGTLMLARVRAHSHRYPDEAWRAAVVDTLNNRARTIPLSHAIEGDRLLSREFAAWFYSNPSAVEDLMVFWNSSGVVRSGIFGNHPPERVGTYSENLAAIDLEAQARKAASVLPRRQRKASGVPDLQTLFNAFPYTWLNIQDSEDQALATSRATFVILALESFRARTGAYPATLAELAPTNPTLDTTDPYTGKPFGYLRPVWISDGRGYLLWSAGNDGIDNGGIGSGSGNSQPNTGLNWGTVNTDVIFNDPPTPATPTPTRPSPAPPGSN